MKKFVFLLGLGTLGVTACTTTPAPVPVVTSPPAEQLPDPTGSGQPSGETQTDNTPAPVNDSGSNTGSPTLPPATDPIESPPIASSDISDAFKSVRGWGIGDYSSALSSFQRSCVKISQKSPDDYLSSKLPKYGRVGDWLAACSVAQATPIIDNDTSRRFFESEFLPLSLMDGTSAKGIITGYYQPEITARRRKDSVYSEPILSVPTNPAALSWSRDKMNESVAAPLGYGRPIDVFFMQVQGSGVMVFEDGQKVRAAYAENNGKPYTSIGRVLISRGILTKDQSSKQSIEDWMIKAGPEEARALMNKNERYIFFRPETILPGEGPKGAMQVPLTAMASIAIDPSQYPYGVPIWLETKIPQIKGDYKGADQQILVVTQDTGKAIRGEHRADLYFGSGDLAGDRAGVMKHPAHWSILLPFHLALQLASTS